MENWNRQGAIKLAKYQTTSDRSKHRYIEILYVIDLIRDKILKLLYIETMESSSIIETKLNLADQLTKLVSATILIGHLKTFGIGDPVVMSERKSF